ncbi:MAG: biotin transporter BioY [Clostridia bacterium]|nr:biotin transporter BioY [Clostridia bacterium]
MKTKRLIICALFAAILCITAPFYIMIGPVPLTFVLFFLALAAFVQGSMGAASATIIYTLIGIVGLPVFSGFKGGIGSIASPTGGFILSYIPLVLLLGLCVKTQSKTKKIIWCALALLVCYTFGTAWYMLVMSEDVMSALVMCVAPFIPFDIVKLYAAHILAKEIQKRIKLKG